MLEGTTLGGRYLLQHLLGRGGMGAVYEATELKLQRTVAVKVLVPELGHETECLARFQREAETTAALGHPNIVQVTDFSANPPEPPFLVMERLQGRSLRDYVQHRGPLSYERATLVALQLLGALSAAHRVGVLHRDLKPHNVFMVDLQGAGTLVKLIDFGLARLTESAGYKRLTATGTLVGTPQYMAPEQLLGEPLDARTDLFSLGLTLFYALTGQSAFQGSTVEELVRSVLHSPQPQLRAYRTDLPPAFVSVLERALHRDPAQRWPDALAMRDALAPFAPNTSSMAAIPLPSLGAGNEAPTQSASPSALTPPTARARPEPPPAPQAPPPAAQPFAPPHPGGAMPPSPPAGKARGALALRVGVGLLLAFAVGAVFLRNASYSDAEEPAPSAPTPGPAAPFGATGFAQTPEARRAAQLSYPLGPATQSFRSGRFVAERRQGELRGNLDPAAGERVAGELAMALLRCLDPAAGEVRRPFFLTMTGQWVTARAFTLFVFPSGEAPSLLPVCVESVRQGAPAEGVHTGTQAGSFANFRLFLEVRPSL